MLNHIYLYDIHTLDFVIPCLRNIVKMTNPPPAILSSIKCLQVFSILTYCCIAKCFVYKSTKKGVKIYIFYSSKYYAQQILLNTKKLRKKTLKNWKATNK